MSEAQQEGLGINDLLTDKRDKIIQLAAKYGASNVRVYGSVARGEATPDSDINFLVDFQPDYSLWNRIELMLDLENLLGRKVDISTEKTLHRRIKQRVLREAVPL
jgi:hypothetical protein